MGIACDTNGVVTKVFDGKPADGEGIKKDYLLHEVNIKGIPNNQKQEACGHLLF